MLGTFYPVTCPHCKQPTKVFDQWGKPGDPDWRIGNCERCHGEVEFLVRVVVEVKKREGK